MRRIIILLIMFPLLMPLQAIKVIDLSDFNIIDKQDMTLVIRDILEKNENDIKIVFPKGVYHFYPDQAFAKYHAITNHDNLYRYFAFPLIERSNIEIDGGGSDFIFHGLITPFLIENSKNVVLRDFSIDWEQPFFFQAEVLRSNEKEKWMDLKVHPMCEPLFEGNRLGFVTNGFHFPFLGESMPFDPKTRAVAYKAQRYALNTVTSRATFDSYLGENEYRIQWFSDVIPPPPGLLYISKGPNKFNRYCPAVHLTDSKDILLKGVTIHHAGGMGVIGEKTENIHIDGLRVVLREGTQRILTTTADATHFCNCKGLLLIENCLFENMLDDASNIHGSYIKMHDQLDSHTLLAKIGHLQQFDYHFAEKGDSICFVEQSSLLPVGYGVVAGVKMINEQMYEISFTNTLPKQLKVGDGLDNISWYPETIFRNNIIRNNRARGILISSRNKTRVLNNSFSSMIAAILFEGDMSFWHEAGAVQDVEIKNNVFLDNAYGGRKSAVIWINPRMAKINPDRPFERNIVVECNEFRTFDNAILSAQSVEGLVFRNNKIIETYTYPKLFPENPTLEIKNCVNTIIESNTYEGKQPARISIDSHSSRTSLIDKQQSGFAN